MKWRSLLISQGPAGTVSAALTHARVSALTRVSRLLPQGFPRKPSDKMHLGI